MKNVTHLFRVLTLCLVTLVSSGAWATVQTYQKVTSAPTDWSGEYLIVYEAGNCAMNGSLTALDAVSNTQAVTIKDNAISLDDSYSFTIAPMDGGYSIQANSGKYMGNASNSNALTSSDNALANTLSLTADGDVLIVSSGGAYLRYNKTSGQTRFRYYKSSSYSNQQAIHLYKKASTTPPTDVLKSLTVSGTPTKMTYEAGEEFDPAGLTVTGTYSESGNKTVTNGITWTITPETLTVGTTSVSVVAKVGDVESSAYTVNGVTVIAPKTLTSIAISGTPTKMEYQVGDAFNPAGLVVTGTYSDSSKEEITDGIEWIITPSTFAEVDVAASVLVVAKVGDIESSPYMATGLIVKEKTTPSALVVDFENALNTYTDWVFTNAEQGTTTITAHGGTYYGTTGGKTTASIQTKDIIAAPQSFTCYISKQSTNTAACTWSIQVSSDGDNWTDVATTDAKAMNKGVWVEFSADLSSYANVYVRIYYSGTTAVRNIDDITLTMGKASSDPSISASNVDIAADATSGEIAYTINNPVAGKTLSATTDATWISNIQVTDDKVTFTSTANTGTAERTATITLKYEGAADKDVTVTQAKPVPTFASLAELIAAIEPTTEGEPVNVTLTNEVITKFYKTGDYTNGVYLMVGTQEIEIYCKNVPSDWAVGGTISGTLENCTWKKFNTTWELCPDNWDALSYTAPVNAHTITISSTIVNGSVTANVAEAIEGQEIILTVTPDEGYCLDELTVNTVMSEPITVIDNKFTMPAYDVIVSATFEAIPKVTVTWNVNGSATDETYDLGAAIDFKPATVPAGFTDYVFRGWITNATVEGATEPTYVTEATATEGVTYYAVFAKKTITGGGSGDYELVTENQSDWSGDYLIAYSDEIFADGRVGGTTGTGMGVQNVLVNPEDNLDGTTVAASWGDLYNVTLEEVSEGSGTYLMLTKDGKYNYQSGNSNGLAATENRDTAEDHPISINFVSSNDVQMIVHDVCIFHYNTQGYFRFYKNGGQSPVYLYKKQEGTVTYSDFCTILPAGLPVVIGSTGYATFYDEDNRIIPTGVKAYYCTQGEEGVLNTVQITNLSYIPRWTGVILEGTPGTYYLEEIPTIMADEEETDKIMDDNVLNGTLDDMSVEDLRAELGDYLVYVLSKVDGRIGFYKFAGDTLAGRKAFYVNANALVSGFILNFEGTEGVNSVISAANLKAGYDLQGRRINQMQKGINILNGKKIIK
ncbi:MAG: bacterial Ig-like domain-containing protein [Bacteroidaceae bacterium]|nr:bacterial Ig-like domain-containing protein [Bacteroidaceae bacterium]